MTDIDTKELRRLMYAAHESGAGTTTREYADYLIALDEAAPALLSEAEEAARLKEQIKRLQKAVERGREFAGTLPAREAVKVRPADWEAIYQAARALTTGGDDARY